MWWHIRCDGSTSCVLFNSNSNNLYELEILHILRDVLLQIWILWFCGTYCLSKSSLVSIYFKELTMGLDVFYPLKKVVDI